MAYVEPADLAPEEFDVDPFFDDLPPIPPPPPIEEAAEVPPPLRLGSPEFEIVYFDFDRSNVRADARPVLRSNGDQLRRAGAAVRIEGHTDERGDEEYNLALGERRAGAVKRYLTDLGVPGSKIRTVSYGEAKPAVAGHNEAAWRYNRRVETVIRR